VAALGVGSGAGVIEYRRVSDADSQCGISDISRIVEVDRVSDTSCSAWRGLAAARAAYAGVSEPAAPHMFDLHW